MQISEFKCNAGKYTLHRLGKVDVRKVVIEIWWKGADKVEGVQPKL